MDEEHFFPRTKCVFDFDMFAYQATECSQLTQMHGVCREQDRYGGSNYNMHYVFILITMYLLVWAGSLIRDCCYAWSFVEGS